MLQPNRDVTVRFCLVFEENCNSNILDALRVDILTATKRVLIYLCVTQYTKEDLS